MLIQPNANEAYAKNGIDVLGFGRKTVRTHPNFIKTEADTYRQDGLVPLLTRL